MHPKLSSVILEEIYDSFLINDLVEASNIKMMSVIFLKNTSVCILVAFFTGRLLGIPLIMFLAVNSVVIGAVFSEMQLSWELLAFVLPHGVFELSAVALAMGMGWRSWRERKKTTAQDMLFFIKAVVPLLFIAAFIEAYVTPIVISYVI